MTRNITTQPRWWQWLTVLSLDAPIVCLLWQALIARMAGNDLRPPQLFVLGVSVWLAYVADRWIEGWRLDHRLVRTQRHSFYQRRRWSVAVVWTAVFVADLAVAWAALGRRDLEHGLLLLAPVLAYLLSHQLVHRHRRWRAPKEVMVAALLTAGVALFLIPSPHVAVVATALLTFAIVAFMNCALISCWERDVDLAHGETSLARDSVRAAGLIRALPWVTAAMGLAAFVALAPSFRVIVGAGVASAILLGLVDWLETRAGWAVARVLADVALMTPIVPLLLMART